MKSLIYTGLSLSVLIYASSFAVVNGDFAGLSLQNGTIQYSEIDDGWYSKNAGTNWDIVGGALEQLSNSGSATRAGQVFSADTLTGSGWFLNFDLADDFLTRVQVYGGLDDGNNGAGNDVMGFGSDGAPTGNIVVGGAWTTLLDTTIVNTGSRSYAINDDLTNYDLIALRFRGNGGTVGARIDNVSFSTTPTGQQLAHGLINGNFDDPGIKRLGNLQYHELGEGWGAKNAFDGNPGTTDNWEVINGELVQVANSGSATRVAQFLLADEMQGTGWSFEFDLAGDNLNRLQIWGGMDDGNNGANDTVSGTGGDGAPNDSIVNGSWTSLLDADASMLGIGSHSFAFAEDFSDFDLLFVRFRGNGGTVGARLDNITFFNPNQQQAIPEPAAAVLALMGVGVIARRRRRAIA